MAQGTVTDRYGRRISYLRLSITDRCNMRCVYCMPEGAVFLREDELLTAEEIERVVRAGVSEGIEKVRVTGGEPLVRGDVTAIVSRLAHIDGITDLSLTTNGQLLSSHASALARAGLGRVNVSLDTLREDRYREICRGGHLKSVLEGIDAARDAGLTPVKVNVVVMRGRNDDEIRDFVLFSLARGVTIRFIEYMPFVKTGEWRDRVVPREEMARVLADMLQPGVAFSGDNGSEPARYFLIRGTDHSIGFISPVTHGFCANCNRLRLTPDGSILACLAGKASVDVRGLLRSGAAGEALREAFREAARLKGESGRFTPGSGDRGMNSIGG